MDEDVTPWTIQPYSTEEEEEAEASEEEEALTFIDSSEDPEESKQCWVCLATSEEDDEFSEWKHPCRCRGTAKWVHHRCLQMWIDEKQKYNISCKVSCTQCNTRYLIIYPSNGKIFYMIELCDKILYSVSPLATIMGAFGSIYWSAFSYGAFTLMQVLGKERGHSLLNKSDQIYLYFGLPSIPVVLILFKFVRWEDQLLKLWLQTELSMFGSKSDAEHYDEIAEQHLAVSYSTESTSICRDLCSALILPTAATFFGKLLFSSVESNLNRTILGGITFILTKGFIKILLRKQQYVRKSNRIILDYDKDVFQHLSPFI